jgi:hypothetical protein
MIFDAGGKLTLFHKRVATTIEVSKEINKKKF